jgi:hypothetical protein
MLKENNLASSFPDLDRALKAVEFQALFTALKAPGGPLGFHGALLGKGGRAIGVIGNKEAGKSTLSTYLWREGYDLYSDDGFQLDLEDLSVVPTPRRSRVRAGCRSLLGENAWSAIAALPETFGDDDGSLLFHPGNLSSSSLQLQALVLLRAESVSATRLTEAEAATALVVLNHLYYTEGLPASLAKTAELSNRVTCYQLGRGELESMAVTIGEIFERPN